MSSIIAYSLLISADVAILMLCPRGFEIRSVRGEFEHLNHFKHYLHNSYYGPVPRLLNYATTEIAAYVNLPADSVGVMGWFKGSDENEDEEKSPITIKVRSKKSDFNVNHMSSCIVFDRLVELFNFSDIAYMKKSNTAKDKMAAIYTDENGYCLELEIFNEAMEEAQQPADIVSMAKSDFNPGSKKAGDTYEDAFSFGSGGKRNE